MSVSKQTPQPTGSDPFSTRKIRMRKSCAGYIHSRLFRSRSTAKEHFWRARDHNSSAQSPHSVWGRIVAAGLTRERCLRAKAAAPNPVHRAMLAAARLGKLDRRGLSSRKKELAR